MFISIIDRLAHFMDAKGLNEHKFCSLTKLSNGLIGKAKKSGGQLKSESIEKILKSFPELNARWLITGEGDMYNSVVGGGSSVLGKSISENITKESVAAIISSHKALISTYKTHISMLEEKIKELEKDL